MYAAQNVDINTQDVAVLREFFRLSLDAPLPPPPTVKPAISPTTRPFSSLWEGEEDAPAARYRRRRALS